MAANAIAGGFLGKRLHSQVSGPSATPVPALGELSSAGERDEAYWWKVRARFDLADGLTFMNNGTLGPLPLPVRQFHTQIFDELAANPTDSYRKNDIERVRSHLATYVGADSSEISFVRSTTEGINLFAHGLDLRPGDEVIISRHEHTSGSGPYRALEQRTGIRIVWVDVPSPPADSDELVRIYERVLTPRTRVIVVSHVSYVTGAVMPIREIASMARDHGVLVSVDGAQSLGMLDLDLNDLGCDHYAAGGQKWLLAGAGTGINYIKADVQDRVWPLMGGGDPRGNEHGPLIYESYGQKDLASLLSMEAALQFHEAIGSSHIEQRSRELGSRLRRGLAEIPGVTLWTSDDDSLACGLTTFSVGDVPMQSVVEGMLAYNGVFLRTMERGDLNAVRASTALYNLPHEVDMVLDGVRFIAGRAEAYG